MGTAYVFPRGGPCRPPLPQPKNIYCPHLFLREDVALPPVVPGEDGAGAAVGAPGLAELADRFFGRLCVQAHDVAELDLDGEVARREDVGGAFGGPPVDFGGA